MLAKYPGTGFIHQQAMEKCSVECSELQRLQQGANADCICEHIIMQGPYIGEGDLYTGVSFVLMLY